MSSARTGGRFWEEKRVGRGKEEEGMAKRERSETMTKTGSGTGSTATGGETTLGVVADWQWQRPQSGLRLELKQSVVIII